ncbi:MAG: hypothetical protein U0931_27450 [Vulcanimicrobiota bacterium]
MLKSGPSIELKPLPAALHCYHPALESRPLLIPGSWLRRLERVQGLLLKVLQAWLVEPGTADFLGITGKARDQVVQAGQRPLRLGCLRPDFIWDDQGRPWICEINARFAVNGFLGSAYLSDQFAAALPQFQPVCQGDRIRQALSLPPGSEIVKGREAGWDIHQLSVEHQAPILRAWTPNASSVVLELHQDELLELDYLPVQNYWNDLRTQWLGHDKRLLHWLGQPERLERYLGAEAEELAGAIVPTWPCASFQPRPGAWVLKPNRSGKGKGLLFSQECAPAEWQQALERAPSEWVVQQQVESLRWEGERLVGTLLSRDLQGLGMGFLRAACGRVVNVSLGGRVLFPMVGHA